VNSTKPHRAARVAIHLLFAAILVGAVVIAWPNARYRAETLDATSLYTERSQVIDSWLRIKPEIATVTAVTPPDPYGLVGVNVEYILQHPVKRELDKTMSLGPIWVPSKPHLYVGNQVLLFQHVAKGSGRLDPDRYYFSDWQDTEDNPWKSFAVTRPVYSDAVAVELFRMTFGHVISLLFLVGFMASWVALIQLLGRHKPKPVERGIADEHNMDGALL
jgi:hypothetical protein